MRVLGVPCATCGQRLCIQGRIRCCVLQGSTRSCQHLIVFCQIPSMAYQIAQPDVLTSARMAAGMTSRARRPESDTPAG